MVASALKGRGGGGRRIHGVGGTQSSLSQLGQTLVCVVTGLKRSMNYNMLRKIYKKRILTLQEKTLFHRLILKTFPWSVQHVYLMVNFKPLLDLSRH